MSEKDPRPPSFHSFSIFWGSESRRRRFFLWGPKGTRPAESLATGMGNGVERGHGCGHQPSYRDFAKGYWAKPVLKWPRGLRQNWMQEEVGAGGGMPIHGLRSVGYRSEVLC